eukprot:601470-Rhodomonas_salina.1
MRVEIQPTLHSIVRRGVCGHHVHVLNERQEKGFLSLWSTCLLRPFRIVHVHPLALARRFCTFPLKSRFIRESWLQHLGADEQKEPESGRPRWLKVGIPSTCLRARNSRYLSTR